MEKLTNSLWIGVDIGKTKVAAGIVNNQGVMKKIETPTNMKIGGYAIIDQVISLIDQLLDKKNIRRRIKGIGIGSSGVVDYKKGVILSSGSIPNWSNINIKDIIEDKFKIQTLVDNDVYVAALGEHYFGIGKGYKSSVFMTISTGVGVAIVLDGYVWHGSHNLAGQIAHLPLFNGKTVNDMFSGKGIATEAEKQFGMHMNTIDVFRKSEEGNKIAVEIISNAAKSAGMVISWLQNTIDPDIFILGGSVALKEEKFIEEIKNYSNFFLRKYSVHLQNDVTIKKAKLGDNAVIVGGAALWITKNNKLNKEN